MSLVTAVEAILTDCGTIALNSQPAEPDNVTTIFNSGGYDPSLSGTMTEEPTFQIRTRNTSAAAALTLLETIKGKLHGYHTAPFLLIAQQGDILPLGQDEKARTELSLNFRTIYRRP